MTTFTLSETSARLATFPAPGSVLHGLLFEANGDASTIVVHIHGMCGNFYHNRFVPTLAAAYNSLGFDMLSVNTSAHDYVAESLDEDSPTLVGGSLVNQETVDADLACVLAALADSYHSIIVQGHSFGCDVVIRNASAFPRNVAGCVLLSPADSLALQEAYGRGMPITQQLDRLRQLASKRSTQPTLGPDVGIGWLGIATPALRYEIPCSLPAAISFLSSGPGVFRYQRNSRAVPGIDGLRAFVYLGGRDRLLLGARSHAVEVLTRSFGDIEIYEPADGDHHFTGLEGTVGRRAARWAARIAPGVDQR